MKLNSLHFLAVTPSINLYRDNPEHRKIRTFFLKKEQKENYLLSFILIPVVSFSDLSRVDIFSQWQFRFFINATWGVINVCIAECENALISSNAGPAIDINEWKYIPGQVGERQHSCICGTAGLLCLHGLLIPEQQKLLFHKLQVRAWGRSGNLILSCLFRLASVKLAHQQEGVLLHMWRDLLWGWPICILDGGCCIFFSICAADINTDSFISNYLVAWFENDHFREYF